MSGRIDGAGRVLLPAEFKQWLKRQRVNRGYSQQELAERCNMAYETYTRMERPDSSRRMFTIDVFVRVAEALEVELGYFLYKAGFPISRDGMDMQRVRRVEGVSEAFRDIESEVRRAMTEAAHTLDVRSGQSGNELPVENAQATVQRLNKALGLLDLAVERLRDEGFLTGAPRPLTADQGTRPWREQDNAFLKRNPDMTHEEAARALGRTATAIRSQRLRLSSLAPEGSEE